ncbi:HK97 gp10 family phage protein [Clostridium culturomicium]|uniref:HK97 gp10 family phage protein n=1 Tax=Clostridium culturomicium TaxID=1499683 RepID=UPI00058EA0FC|nr:HK97 gp10 family phage protein [Clostridium culturomicium]
MLENNINDIKSKLQSAIEEAVREIEISGVADLQANAPVDTGALKRAIAFKTEKGDDKYVITFGSMLKYAPYTEFRNSTSKGWMRDTLNELDAENILIKHLKGVND